MDDIDHNAGITFEFSAGVLTASCPDWTAQLEAWPEPRISFLRYERAEDDEEDRREALLNLPNSESNRRILLKVIPEARDAFCFDILANLEKNPRVHRIVEHLPQINTGITHILSWHPPYGNLTGPLLTEIAQLEDYESIDLYYRLFNDTVDLLERAGMGDKKVHSIRSLEKLHDEICRRAPESLMYKHERNFTFPPPPYPGTPYIEPITTPEDLFREGMEMRHCVAIYAERVANSECYCYRVTAPVRATLEVRRDNNGEWQFSQMRKKCNWLIEDKIIDETWRALRESAKDYTCDLTIRSSGEFEQQLPLLTEDELAIFKQVTAAFAG